jgi:hypothetical protein
MPKGKHSPNRLRNYMDVHEARMQDAMYTGFVLKDETTFSAIRGAIVLLGRISCKGGIYIDVNKTLRILKEEGENSTVRTERYSYNVVLHNSGNIFRYDSPGLSGHKDEFVHHFSHHVHRYDVLNNDKEGRIEILSDEEDVPLLSEVIDEAASWFYQHIDVLDV